MTHDDTSLRRHLRSMPEPPLPDTLQSRLHASHTRRGRLLRTGTGAAVVALLAVMLLPFPHTTQPPAASTAASQDAAADARRARLEVIDRALQAAYQRGASDDEVAPLWKARQALLDEPPPSRTSESASRRPS
jgi:hypothetical protein